MTKEESEYLKSLQERARVFGRELTLKLDPTYYYRQLSIWSQDPHYYDNIWAIGDSMTECYGVP